MTYLVLARKWRPRSFDTLIGQDHVVRALTHALSTQRLHHAWLFTGTRGVGKTTLSRILSKSLNCETGITATPCGVCRACTEIDEGRFVDYLELDAASNRGVDEMTQLLEQAVYAPSVGRFKVYMIDEVHMLTGHAFNAMLKTLEEPPPHVKFILATTDPQKIPVTVLSRCLQFNLKQMTAQAIVGHLEDVLAQENIAYEVPALRLIAQAASGSMRDALSLTDQAIAYSAENLSAEAVRGMLGTIDQRYLARLLQALSAGRGADVLAVADELASRGLSYSGALADLAVLLSRIAIEQRLSGTVPADDPLAGEIAALAESLHPDLVQLFYSVAVHSRGELSLAPDEYAGFVMACLRMLALAPQSAGPAGADADGSAARRTESAPSDELKPSDESGPRPTALPPEPAAAVQPAAKRSSRPIAEPVVEPIAQSAPASPPSGAPAAAVEEPAALVRQADAGSSAMPPEDDVPAWEDEPGPQDHAGNEDDDGPLDTYFDESGFIPDTSGFAPPAREKHESPGLRTMTAQDWPGLAASLPLTGLAAELARQSEWLGARDSRIDLRVAVRSLAESPGKSRLRTVLSEHFGTVVSLNVEYGATGDATAHAVAQARQQELQQQAERAVRTDPFIQELVDEFDASVVPGSIRPLHDDKAA